MIRKLRDLHVRWIWTMIRSRGPEVQRKSTERESDGQSSDAETRDRLPQAGQVTGGVVLVYLYGVVVITM